MQFDAKLRDAVGCINASLAREAVSKMLDEDFVLHIRKMSGCEQKIVAGSFTYAKGALDEVLQSLRVVGGLIKACRVFHSKLEGNNIKAGDRLALQQAFTAYRASKSSTVPQGLAWCLVSLELMTAYSIAVVMGTPAVHPATSIDKATTLREKNCTVAQWATLIEELVICGLEEFIKKAETDKSETELLKATFR